MLMVISYKNVINNILSHNLIKEGLKPELEEICMLYFLLENQPMAQEEILHLETLEFWFIKIDLENNTEKESFEHMNLL
jgi:hypothetical protein